MDTRESRPVINYEILRIRRGEPGRPRWGLRTLGFLALCMVAMITSQVMGGYTVGSLGSLVFGLVGAAYCSVRGLQTFIRDGGIDGMVNRRR